MLPNHPLPAKRSDKEIAEWRVADFPDESITGSLGVVAAGYAAVLLVAAGLIFARHLQYMRHPADAAGGMGAFGDLMLALFIAGMLLIPTFLLVFFIRTSETASTRYSQALVGVSLTAPVCLGVLLIPAVSQGNSLPGWLCMYRVLVSPLVVVGLAVSRLLARFSRAKRLASYALLVASIAAPINRPPHCRPDPLRLAAVGATSPRDSAEAGRRGFPTAAGSRTKVSPVNNETHLRAGVFPPH